MSPLPPLTKSKPVIITFVLTVFSLIYNAIDAVGNAEFLLQKIGVSERVARFLGSPRGIDFLVAISLLALVGAVAFQVRRYQSEGVKKRSDSEATISHGEHERLTGNLEAQVKRLQEHDVTWGVQVASRDGDIERLKARLDETKWLRDIAEEQAKSIQDHLDIDCHVGSSHKLVGDNQYIDFTFGVTNRSVYKITLMDQLSGSLHFGQRRLTKAPVLSENSVKNLELNKMKWFTISQPLTSSEAAEILTDVPGQFGLYGLHAKIAGSPNLTEPVDFKWLGMTGPIVSKEFIASNYPKLDIQIDPSELRTYFGHRDQDGLLDSLGSVVSLKVRFKNPRPLRVRQFKLVTSDPVVPAEKGVIRERPRRNASGHHEPQGQEMSPNLADLNIDVERGNTTEGWLQFIVKGIVPPQMLRPEDFVVRLHIVDESGEEHRQDVLGLKYNPSGGLVAG